MGDAERFADYSQWEDWRRAQEKGSRKDEGSQRSAVNGGKAEAQRAAPAADITAGTTTKRKLSFAETREFETIEKSIAEAERELGAQYAALEDPAVVSDAPALQRTGMRIEELQKKVEDFYSRWAELERKKS
jgi:ATP-binding cassette subfamily F protein uup